MADLDKPQTWATGGDPPTEAQLSFLKTLANDKGVEVPDDLDKGGASKKIDELKNMPASGGSESAKESGVDKDPSSDEPPADSHLAHPENWATGGESATSKQKAYVAVLQKKAGGNGSVDPNMTKTEASELIEELK